MAEHIKMQDIVITTALIPGRKAPVLVTEEMVKTMKPGSVIVDMAVEQGGNCPLSEFGKVVEKYGVKIVGPANLPAELATDASALFSRNLLNFITPMVDKETKALKIDLDDEIVKGTLVTRDGQIVHPSLSQSLGAGRMDDKLAGEAAKLATQAQELAGQPQGHGAADHRHAAAGHARRCPTATCRSWRCSPSSRWPASSATTWSGG